MIRTPVSRILPTIGGSGMSGVAAAYRPNWRHAVMCMRVLSSARAALLVSAKYASLATSRVAPILVLLVPRWPQNNKRLLHHPSYLPSKFSVKRLNMWVVFRSLGVGFGLGIGLGLHMIDVI